MEYKVDVGSFSVVIRDSDSGGFVEFSLDFWGWSGDRVF